LEPRVDSTWVRPLYRGVSFVGQEVPLSVDASSRNENRQSGNGINRAPIWLPDGCSICPLQCCRRLNQRLERPSAAEMADENVP
jgi:hypothetical protein